MKKRMLAMMLAGAMTVGCMAGCSSTKSDDAGSAAGAANAAGADEVYTLSCAYELADDHAWAVQFQKMAEEVEKESGGRLKIELYGNGQMGAESQLITQLMSGSLDMMPTSVNNISASYAPCLVLAAPYGIKNLDEAYKVYESDWGKQKLKDIEDNTKFRGLGVLYGGMRQCFTTSKPINSIEDMKGMKMRVPEWQMYLTMFSEWGASPTPMDFSEVYLSLQQGVVDGMEQPIEFFMAANLQEVTKNIVMTNHQAEVSMLWINSDKYNSLPADLQKILDEASVKYCKAASDTVEANEEEMIQKLIDEYGFTKCEPDLKPFQEAALVAIHEYDDEWGAESYNEMMKVIEG